MAKLLQNNGDGRCERHGQNIYLGSLSNYTLCGKPKGNQTKQITRLCLNRWLSCHCHERKITTPTFNARYILGFRYGYYIFHHIKKKINGREAKVYYYFWFWINPTWLSLIWFQMGFYLIFRLKLILLLIHIPCFSYIIDWDFRKIIVSSIVFFNKCNNIILWGPKDNIVAVGSNSISYLLNIFCNIIFTVNIFD